MRTLTRLIALLLALTLAFPALPQQAGKPAPMKEVQAPPAAAAAEEDTDVEPKFIWGILIKIAVQKLGSYAFEAFSRWAVARLTGSAEGLTFDLVASLARTSGARISQSMRGATQVAARSATLDAPPIVVANPDKPLVADGKKENYQGVYFAIAVADPSGRTLAARPINEGFRTGERFKLRVLSTFGGELTIENINPRGERKQVFPPRPDQVVTLLPGSETLIPMDPNQFFEFTGSTGREQLVINLVDPRAVGAAASRNNVFRQDTKYGSNFLQEVSDSTYPNISQGVELVHSAR